MLLEINNSNFETHWHNSLYSGNALGIRICGCRFRKLFYTATNLDFHRNLYSNCCPPPKKNQLWSAKQKILYLFLQIVFRNSKTLTFGKVFFLTYLVLFVKGILISESLSIHQNVTNHYFELFHL